MAGIGAAVVGGGIALAVAGYSNGTGFIARHETAHAQQVAETKRIIAEFEEAYKRGEVSEEDWNKFLEIRTDVRDMETDYEESIEGYKEIPVYQFITKWRKLHQVREKKRKLRKVNRKMRKHYYDSTSDPSDTSSIVVESGSPPRKHSRLDRYSDEDEERILSWANEVVSDSCDDAPVDYKPFYGDCAHDRFTWKHDIAISTVSFSPDGREVLSGDARLVYVLDWARRTAVKNYLEGATSRNISAMTFSPDCVRAVANCRNGPILLWDAHTGRLLSEYQVCDGEGTWSTGPLTFTMDGQRVMSLCQNATTGIQLWDTGSGRSTFHPIAGIRPFSFFKPSSDGTRITFGTESDILISDLGTGKIIAGPMRGHTGEINSLVFSSDDSLVVSASDDKTIRIWDSRTGEAALSQRLAGHTSWVSCVDISSDGRRIASGSTDKTVRIWDTRTGETLETLDGYDSWINHVAFSPDANKVVSGSRNGTARLWDVSARGWNRQFGEWTYP